MHGEFDPVMQVSGTDELEVCGPIKWPGDAAYDLPAVSIEIVAVFVVQPMRSGPAIAGVATAGATFEEPDMEWELTLKSLNHEIWVPGPAMALAVVHVRTAGRLARWNFERWNETIALF